MVPSNEMMTAAQLVNQLEEVGNFDTNWHSMLYMLNTYLLIPESFSDFLDLFFYLSVEAGHGYSEPKWFPTVLQGNTMIVFHIRSFLPLNYVSCLSAVILQYRNVL
jgi:hypothetical protein